jgi:Ca2+-binding RTX toxin-like protein
VTIVRVQGRTPVPVYVRVYVGVSGLLAMLSLFGALMAGVAADALLTGRPENDADPDDLPEESEDSLADGNLLDDIETGVPVSDDIPDPVDAPVKLEGGDTVDKLSGLGGDDWIKGHGGSDLIDGRAGADWIEADAGNDAVWAGEGDDSIWGGEGNDSVWGDAGNDVLAGGAGMDSLAGCEGDDSLTGGAGNDTVLGGAGDDWQAGNDGDDWLAGGMGNDSLVGNKGTDIIDGNDGDDWLSGLNGKADDGETDYLNGGVGNDRLILGAGDHAMGGEGEDEFVLDDRLYETSVATIADYDPEQDHLVIVYDPSVHPDPELSLGPNEGGPGQVVYLDGAKIAVVSGAKVALSDIRLVAE